MPKSLAALVSVAFFALAPGFVAGVMPWYLTSGWERNDMSAAFLLRVSGGMLIAAGFASVEVVGRPMVRIVLAPGSATTDINGPMIRALVERDASGGPRVTIRDLKLGAELAKTTRDRADYLELRRRAQATWPEAELVKRVREVLTR